MRVLVLWNLDPDEDEPALPMMPRCMPSTMIASTRAMPDSSPERGAR